MDLGLRTCSAVDEYEDREFVYLKCVLRRVDVFENMVGFEQMKEREIRKDHCRLRTNSISNVAMVVVD